MSKCKVTRIAKESWKWRTKCEDSCFVISELTTKLQWSRQYGTGIKIDTQINGTLGVKEINP